MKRYFVSYTLIIQSSLLCASGQESIKVYTLTTPNTRELYQQQLLPSMPNDCQSVVRHHDKEVFQDPAGYNLAKIECILDALHQNKDKRFIYADPSVQLLTSLKPLAEHPINEKDLLIQGLFGHNKICTHLFISKTNRRARDFWSEIYDKIATSPETDMDLIVAQLLQEKHRPPLTWDYLPATFTCNYLTDAQDPLSLTYDPKTYHAHFAKNPQEALGQMHLALQTIFQQKETVSQLLTKARSLERQEKFILITMLYDEKITRRAQEYICCMEKNLQNPFIDKIHVLYDTSADTQDSRLIIKKYLETKDVIITDVVGRQTYDNCFSLAHLHYPERKIMIANADIFFNESLGLLSFYDLTNKFLAISRWEPCDEFTNLNIASNRYCRHCQDVWIYQDPLPPFQDATITLGTRYCDGRIILEAQKAGLTVLNPCLTVQCVHVHASHIRHYDKARIDVPRGKATPSCLKLKDLKF